MHYMYSTAVCTLSLIALVCVVCCSVPAHAQSLEARFNNPSAGDRSLTGPLLWLHGDDSEARLRLYVSKVAEGGNGSFTTESRPHTDWLGPTWFRDLGICLDEAKKHNLKMWIFDEKWWPSQSVAGKVTPRYAAKRLAASEIVVSGPRRYEADGFSGGRYIAAVAGHIATDGAIDGKSLIDLAPYIHDGKLVWTVPNKRWKVMKFTHVQAPGLGQSGGAQLSVDGASRDCVEWFLQTVYQPHYDHFKADFGKTIQGFFYDEPETQGDWGTEVPRVLAELGVDWKQAYVAYKFQLSGDAQASARYRYLEARAEAWGRTMYGGITRWCESRGVKSIGHFMEHAGMYRQLDYCAGDLMRVQKYSSTGGIDAVFSQFKPGQRAAYDPPSWQTPKLGSSISHAYGKADDVTMCEIFGARGQDLEYSEMKWWADHMFVSGINFLIPHSFNPHAPYDTDCPPYFYNGGYEPRWPLYRVFADYAARLSLILSGGRHVAPVALLSPGLSAHVGNSVPLDQISESLQDALYDCDWIPYEVFEKDMKVAKGTLTLRAESYQVLVIPATEVIPYATLAKARQFFERGGAVVGYGFLPTKSATPGKSTADIARLREAIWGSAKAGMSVCKCNSAGGRSFLLPADPSSEMLKQVLAGVECGVPPVVEVLDGMTDNWLHVVHRVKDGRDIYFITNQNHLGAARDFQLKVRAHGVPECWDPIRNEIRAVSYYREGDAAIINITLQPNEAILLVFQPDIRLLPLRYDASSVRVIPVIDPTRMEKVVVPPAKLVVDRASYGIPGDAARTLDVRDQLQRLIDGGVTTLWVARLATGKDPAPNIVKTLDADIQSDGKLIKILGLDPQTISLYGETNYAEVLKNSNGRQVTLSPVVGDPFHGTASIPADINLSEARIYLKMDGLPDDSASVSVNGEYVGGCIGKPCRVNVTVRLKPGVNTFEILPRAPKSAWLVVY